MLSDTDPRPCHQLGCDPNPCAAAHYRRLVDNHVALTGPWAGWRLAGRDLVAPDRQRISPERLRGLMFRGASEKTVVGQPLAGSIEILPGGSPAAEGALRWARLDCRAQVALPNLLAVAKEIPAACPNFYLFLRQAIEVQVLRIIIRFWQPFKVPRLRHTDRASNIAHLI